MFSQNNTLEELNKRRDELFSEKIAYGKYEKPKTLIKLIELVKENNLDTDRSLGFILWKGTKPEFPAPIDNIPFAWTGGDGCYFGFLTDFGNNSNLEEAPIIFVSPADFDKKNPHWGVKLFARNIKDFLSIMIKTWYAEIVRFNELTEMDFKGAIKVMHDEYEEFDSDKEKAERKRVIDFISNNFDLKTIDNLNEYYKSLHAERKELNLIETMDGIGISNQERPKITANSISEPIEIEQLESQLNNLSLDERKKFYRDVGLYLYPHYEENFNDVLEIMGKYLIRDGFEREANIVNMGIKLSKDYKKHIEKKKEKKENER